MTSFSIAGNEYQCATCGKYFYVKEGAGSVIPIRCPFCYGNKGTVKIGFVKIIKYMKRG